MMKKEFELCKKLVKLIPIVNTLDLSIIMDFFMWKTLYLLTDRINAEQYILLFESFDNYEIDDFHKGFFFALAQILSLKYEFGYLEGDAITKDSFNKSFKDFLEKYDLTDFKVEL